MLRNIVILGLSLLGPACNPTPATTASDSDGETSDTDGETSDTSTTETDSGGMVCPDEEDVRVDFDISPKIEPLTTGQYDWTCDMLTQEVDDVQAIKLQMQCSDGDMTTSASIRIWTQPALPDIMFPDQVNVRFFQAAAFGDDRWLRIETTSEELIFAASLARSLAKDFESEEVYGPFSATSMASECSFYQGTCGTYQKNLVTLSQGQDSWELIHPQVTTIADGYQVWLREASDLVGQPVDCSDVAGSWYSMAIARQP